MNKDILLSPSLLSADFCNLGLALDKIKNNGGSLVHIDVMDGHFVPPVSYGQPVISSIRKYSDLPFDVHLMVEKPELSIPSFLQAGSDYITFHAEATSHADRCVQLIKEAGKKAGIALCPATPISSIEHLLPLVDIVLIMTVNPGWGGQKLIPYTIDKVSFLADKQKEHGFKYLISVDGGINEATLSTVVEAGVNIVVSGSAFFEGKLNWKGK